MHCHFDCVLNAGVGCFYLPGAVHELLEGVIALHERQFSRVCLDAVACFTRPSRLDSKHLQYLA